ncbi:hypothetical protein [Candidatus Mycoplasma haematohominis]|uniref:Uncharacterized protein n=1 Tax=Candidatus Mycoplasma haematohominis TaxID=1494318 RepID=A0A478FQT6_9MOLU|nr:hypothetical protein [Candidatus Mycoplasma haemohominis]GCE63881.1 hypothetical protein MHSWG343_08880 [Candidatus Mycoplasma haemohominis]
MWDWLWKLPPDLDELTRSENKEKKQKILDELNKEKGKKKSGESKLDSRKAEDSGFSWDGILDGLGCWFGLDGRNKDVCNDVYLWLFELKDKNKYGFSIFDGLNKGERKIKFYDFERKIKKSKPKPPKETPKKKPEVPPAKVIPLPKSPEVPPKTKEKSEVKPGGFGYYGWHIDWKPSTHKKPRNKIKTGSYGYYGWHMDWRR